LTLRWELK